MAEGWELVGVELELTGEEVGERTRPRRGNDISPGRGGRDDG